MEKSSHKKNTLLQQLHKRLTQGSRLWNLINQFTSESSPDISPIIIHELLALAHTLEDFTQYNITTSPLPISLPGSTPIESVIVKLIEFYS